MYLLIEVVMRSSEARILQLCQKRHQPLAGDGDETALGRDRRYHLNRGKSPAEPVC